VTNSDGVALEGVRLTLNTGQHTTSGSNGNYIFTDLADGSYTITLEKDYYSFTPAQRTVNVGPDAAGQDFTGDTPGLSFRPYPDGYRFDNYGGVRMGDYTVHDMRQMFGDDAVCWMVFGLCVPKPAAVAWNVQANYAMQGGHCDGMASTSLLFFKGFGDPSEYQSGAGMTYDLTLDNARRNIAYYFVEQLTDPVRSYKAQSVQYSPREILQQLSTALSSGADPTTIIVRQRQSNGRVSGHAMTPYAIEDRGSGIYWIHVYDNNYHGDETRHIVVDTANNTWSYEMGSSTWQGNSGTHTLGIVPISRYRADPVCPWCTNNQMAIGTFPYEGDTQDSSRTSSTQPYESVWFTGKGHLLISDSQDRVMGYVGNKLVNDFAEEYVTVIDAGADVALEPLYTFPLSDTYTLLLDGQTLTTTESVAVTLIGAGHAAEVEGILLDDLTQDRVAISPDGNQIAYQASRLQEANLTLHLEDTNTGGQFTVRGADIFSGQVVALGVDTTSQFLVYTNQQDEEGIYSVDIDLVDGEGRTRFLHGGVTIDPMDIHYLSYGEWDGENEMLLYIDHGQDGSIDETIALPNQSNFIFLPLVARD
jgi:hypothetical protein